MGVKEARAEAAEGLYKLISAEVEKVAGGQYGSPSSIIESLARAYALVTESPAPTGRSTMA